MKLIFRVLLIFISSLSIATSFTYAQTCSSITNQSVVRGNYVNLTWITANTAQCTGGFGIIGEKGYPEDAGDGIYDVWRGSSRPGIGTESFTSAVPGGGRAYAPPDTYTFSCQEFTQGITGCAQLTVLDCDPGMTWDNTLKTCVNGMVTVTLNPFSPSTISVGESSTISFTSTNATACFGEGAWAGNLGGTATPPGGVSTGAMSIPGTYKQKVTCVNTLGQAAVSVERTLTVVDGTVAPYPDLTAGSISQTTATEDTPISLSGNITNAGTLAVNQTFSNLFQVSNSSNGANPSDISGAQSTGSITPGGSKSISTQSQYTFSTSGTFYVRLCADKANASDANGVVAETNAEGNNCGPWSAITVSPGSCGNGAIDPPTCTVCPVGKTYSAGSCVNTGASYNLQAISLDTTRNNVSINSIDKGASFYLTATAVNWGSSALGPLTGTQAYIPINAQKKNSSGVITNFNPAPDLSLIGRSLPANAASGLEIGVNGSISTAGNFEVRLCIDNDQNMANGVVAETNETDNCSGWKAITINETCPNGATDYPTCIVCPLGSTMVGGVCVLNNNPAQCGTEQYTCNQGVVINANQPEGQLASGNGVGQISNWWSYNGNATWQCKTSLSGSTGLADCSKECMVPRGNQTISPSATLQDGVGLELRGRDSVGPTGDRGYQSYVSPLDKLVVHLGLIPKGGTGVVKFVSRPKVLSFYGSFANGITSQDDIGYSTYQCAMSAELVAQVDLVSGVVSPTTANIGTALTFSSTISNTGPDNISSGTTIPTFFQVATASNGGGTLTTLSSATTISGLNAGQSKPFTSNSYTFSSPGTYSIRTCVDKSNPSSSGMVTETNEDNNCGTWSDVTVSSTCNVGQQYNGTTCVTPPAVGSASVTGPYDPAGEITFTCSNSTAYSVVKTDSTAPGTTWASQSPYSSYQRLEAVAFGNGKFVTAAGNGYVHVSTDNGATWSEYSVLGNNDAWSDITYGNGLFVAVGQGGDYAGDNTIMTSTDGITWTARIDPGNWVGWNSVAYGNNMFVAVGISNLVPNSSTIMTSPDGITWTLRSPLSGNDGWKAVTYGNGLFVAVGDGGDYAGKDSVMTSPDGINWTAQTTGRNDNWQDVTYGNGLFVAVGDGGNTLLNDNVMTSPDGITWTIRNAGATDTFFSGVTFGNNTFVAVGMSGASSRVMTSTNGTNWTTRSALGNDDQWSEIAYGNNTFIAVGVSAQNMMISGQSQIIISGSYPPAPSVLPVSITEEGNYQVLCKNGTLEDGKALYYNSPPPIPRVELTASPKTVGRGGKSVISWKITQPTTSCMMSAKIICSKEKCTPAQELAKTRLASFMATAPEDGNTSIEGTYNGQQLPPRYVSTAIKYVTPGYEDQSLSIGKMSYLTDSTTDFTLDCGASSLQKSTVRIRVTQSAEQ